MSDAPAGTHAFGGGVQSRAAHPVDPTRVAHARARGLSAEDAERLTSLLSLIADPVRARIRYARDEVEAPRRRPRSPSR